MRAIRIRTALAVAVVAWLTAEVSAQSLQVAPIPEKTGWVRVQDNVVTIENWGISNPSSSRRTTGTLYVSVRATRSSQSTSTGYHVFDVNEHPNRRGLARLDGGRRLAPGQHIDISRMIRRPLRQPPAGTYYIHIAVYQWDTSLEDNGARTQIGSHTMGEQFTFSDDDHGNDLINATGVALPSATAGRIESGNDVDYFQFEVSGTRTVTASTTGSLDTVGTLHDTTGRQLASNDDSGSGLNFHIRRSLAAGTYYVRVASYSTATGDYTLRLAADDGHDFHGNALSSATRVALPSTTTGGIDPGNDVDYFRFEVSETRTVTASTAGGSLNTVGTLYDSAGRQLATDDDSGNYLNFSIRRSLAAGTYYVRVASYGTAIGFYTLRLTTDDGGGDDHGDVPPSGTQVALPSTITGSIESGDDVDYFRFEVSGTRTVTASTTGSLDTVGTLQDSAGRRIASDDDSGSGLNFSIPRSLAAGTYYVRVRSYGKATGDYTLRLAADRGEGDDHQDVLSSSATRVALPSTTAGRIESGNDVDYFQFEVSGTRTVTAGTTGSLDTVGTLYDSAGQQLATDDDSGSRYNFGMQRSLAAGTYYVRVASYRTATGAYALVISSDGDACP